MSNKIAERPPRQRTPDIIQFMTRLAQQVIFKRPTMLFYKAREAQDSPRDAPSMSDADFHASMMELKSSTVSSLMTSFGM